MRRSREADITDVLNKIIRRIRDSELAKKLGQKVLNYYRSKDPKKDLSLSESRLIYRDDNYGDTRPLSKKRDISINWTDHAEYRSDLRDIDRKDVNQTIVERLIKKLRKPDSKKIKFKEPGVGSMIVDYDLRKDPAQADVVTVWAAHQIRTIKRSKRIASTGNCYEANGSYFMENALFPGNNKKLKMVHGEVTGQGSLDGVKYGHAWIEDGNTVIDVSNGKNIKMSKKAYYQSGHIGENGNIHTYSPEKFREKILQHEHWGPWDLRTSTGL